MKYCLIVLIVVLSGCSRPDYVASDIKLQRTSWDSVLVSVDYRTDKAFSDPSPAVPDSVAVRLFSAGFDTLFVGTDSVVAVPDRDLGDRERALIEVCGFFGREVVCSQGGVEASPKRVEVTSDLVYPEKGDYDLGRYRFSYEGRRLAFGATAPDSAWEKIDMPTDSEHHLTVRVLGERGEPITVPLPNRRGRFKLTNLTHNADFRRNLLAQLLDADEATVRFEVYSSAFNITSPIWVSDTIVEAKTEQTRELEAGYFVEEAGSRLLDLLRTFPVGPNIYLFMNSWSYDRETGIYDIELSLSWQSSFIRSRWFELEAGVRVAEDGTDPVVSLLRGNERGIRRWEQRFDGREIELDRILPRPDPRPARRDTVFSTDE